MEYALRKYILFKIDEPTITAKAVKTVFFSGNESAKTKENKKMLYKTCANQKHCLKIAKTINLSLDIFLHAVRLG